MLLQFSNIGQKINKRKFSFVQCIVPSIASLPGGRACTFNFFLGKDRAARPLAELRAQVSKLGGWSRSSVFGRAATLNFFLGKDRAARQPGELRVRSSKLRDRSRTSHEGRAATFNFFLGKYRAARQPGEVRGRSS